ncbi:hypothetical protein WA158_003193 [Blastocystis sp. Blastoise]
MGIYGFYRLLGHSHKYPSLVDRNEEIDVVVDGHDYINVLLRRFPFEYSTCESLVYRNVEIFFYKLKRYKMNPICFLYDYSTLKQKEKSFLKTRNVEFNSAVDDYANIKKRTKTDFRPSNGTSCYYHCIRKYIESHKLNCELIRPLGDGDRCVANYSKTHDCYVLTCDTDLFLYDVKGVIYQMDLNAFDTTSLLPTMYFNDRYVYSPQIISNYLKIPISYFPLFGVLAGCDTVTFFWERPNVSIEKLCDVINYYNGNIYMILSEFYQNLSEIELNERVQNVKDNLGIYNENIKSDYPFDIYPYDNSLEISREEFKQTLMKYMKDEKINQVINDHYYMKSNMPWSFLINNCNVVIVKLPTDEEMNRLCRFCFDILHRQYDKFFGDTRPFFHYRYLLKSGDAPSRGTHMDFFKAFDIFLKYKETNIIEILHEICDIYELPYIYENIDIQGNFPYILPLAILLYHRYNTACDLNFLKSLAFCHYNKHIHKRRICIYLLINNHIYLTNNDITSDSLDLITLKEEYISVSENLFKVFTSLGQELCISAVLYDYYDIDDGSIIFVPRENSIPFEDWYPQFEQYLIANNDEWTYIDIPLLSDNINILEDYPVESLINKHNKKLYSSQISDIINKRYHNILRITPYCRSLNKYKKVNINSYNNYKMSHC